MTPNKNTADGQYVVVQNGQRVAPSTPIQQEAEKEAQRLNKLHEGSGQPVREGGKAAVKQNLFG